MTSPVEDDDVPQLSAETLVALQEFYSCNSSLTGIPGLQNQTHSSASQSLSENWKLSQFWYDDYTADILSKECLQQATDGRIALVSAPTIYQKLQEVKAPSTTTILLEFDERFSIYDKDFVFYDYNSPLELSNLEANSFDLVLADPPYLSKECLSKVAQTILHLRKDKVILCTGAVMEDIADRLLGVTKCNFIPHHTRNLANEFRCYANFETVYLKHNNS